MFFLQKLKHIFSKAYHFKEKPLFKMWIFFLKRVKLEEILTTANINLPANAGGITDVA